MTQRESRLSQNIMRELRAVGYFCFKIHGTELVMAGLPDIIVCVEGRFVGLEVKHPETREDTSARQDFVHDQIRVSGGIAEVVTSAREALEVCRRAAP